MARLFPVKEGAAIRVAREAPIRTWGARIQELLDAIGHALSSHRS
jgi:hypothetical protein